MSYGFVHTIMHVKLLVHKTVTVGANLCCLIYNVLIDIVFPIHLLLLNSKKYQMLKILVEDILNTKGLVTLTQHQQVG